MRSLIFDPSDNLSSFADVKKFSSTSEEFDASAKQFTKSDFKRVFATTALNALKTVMEQGEGGGAVAEENSHYTIFKHLLGEFRDMPWKLYNVPKNPVTTKYPRGSYIRKVTLLGLYFVATVHSRMPLIQLSRAFDAVYCYLLLAIESVWDKTRNISANTHSELVTSIKKIMPILTDLAGILLLQPFGDGCAAPCFNYYKGKKPLGATALHSALLGEIKSAIGRVPAEEDISIAVGHAVKAAGEATILVGSADDAAALLAGAKAIRAGVLAINTPSLGHANKAVTTAEAAAAVAQKVADAAKTAADAQSATEADQEAAAEAADYASTVKNATHEANLYLGQKAELEKIHRKITDDIKPVGA